MADHIPSPKTIPALLEYWSKIDPETPAFIFLGRKEETVFSRGEIFVKAGKMAAVLRRIGMSKGDIIAVSMYDGQNCPDRLICELGIQMAGCVAVEASADLKNGSDMIQILIKSNAKMLIVCNGTFQQEYTAPLSTVGNGFVFTVARQDVPSLEYLIRISNDPSERLDDILEEEETIFMEDVSPSDRAMIATTSGTTSLHKLVPCTQDMLLRAGDVMCRGMGATGDSRLFNDRSMSWMPGFPIFYLMSGLTRVLINHVDQRLLKTQQVLQQGNITHAFLFTEDAHELYLSTRAEEKVKFDSINVVFSGQPIKKSLVEETLTYATSVTNMYGTTEIGIISNVRVNNEDEFEDYCVGIELPDFQIKIIDEKEREVAFGQIGAILIKEPSFRGYLNVDGSLDRDCLTQDGWLRMGDLGYRDEQGRLYVTGRGSDVIIRGDLIVYPHQVENFLATCPGVEEVAVVGVPDPIVHQEMCVFVKGTAQDNDIITDLKRFIDEHVKSGLEYNLIPKYFLTCESILRNTNRKIDRKKMTKLAMQELDIVNY